MGAISRAVKRVYFEIHSATYARPGRDFNERTRSYSPAVFLILYITIHIQTGISVCDWFIRSYYVWAALGEFEKEKKNVFFSVHTHTHEFIYNIKTFGQKNDKYCGSINISAFNNGSLVSIIIIWLYRVSPRI